MAPKFGNYLFRNLNSPQAGESDPARPPAADPPRLDDRVICLTETDFVSDEAFVPALAWDQCPGRRIEVRLGDTSGLMNGRVTIQAGALRRIAGPLVPSEVPDDFQLPISLRTVVLQVQPFLQQANPGTLRPSGPDFDTPIAQVAREDEGFFKLEKTPEAETDEPSVELPGAGVSLMPPTPPAFPLIREKSVPPSAASSESGPAALPVNVVRPQTRGRTPDDAGEKRYDPFAVLPQVGTGFPAGQTPSPSGPSLPRRQAIGGETIPEANQPASVPSETPSPWGMPGKPTRRAALERLQEIFMTDDLLDFAQVLRLVGQFPRVSLAFAVTRDGAIYGEGPPLGAHAALAVGLTDAARRFARLVAGTECQGVTVLAEKPLSIVGNEHLSLVLLHDGRALPPGMKERVGAIAQALSELLPPAQEG